MTKCQPALAFGLNGWNAPACAKAVKAARQDWRERRFFESVNGK